MSKTIAFYDPYITGHHVEYLYHIAHAKIINKIEAKFIFCVSKDFDKQLNELISTEILIANQIEIIHIEDFIGVSDFEFVQSLNNYKKQLVALNKAIIKEEISHCVFMYLDNAMQIALSTNVGKNLNCKISGIVLNPFGGFGKGLNKYYYSFRRIMQNYIMLTNRRITGIYIIINKKTANRLNFMHLTSKFRFVSDPVLKTKYLAVNNSKIKTDIRRITFLLFGSLNKRKGIFTTLYALDKLTSKELSRIKIIFAGKLADTDKNLFMDVFNSILKRDKDALELMDRYLAYRDIPQLFTQSAIALLPYDATQASSGVLGHTAYYQIPVIGQGGGIFEKHIINYSLGKIVRNMNALNLADLFKAIINGTVKIECNKEGTKKYINSRSGEFFASTIIQTALK